MILPPNTIIIGAGRCATTTLHRTLGEHPQIFASAKKELNFWTQDEHGRQPPWMPDSIRHAPPRQWHHYLGYFANAAPQHKVRLESSPAYMSDPRVARRICDALPTVSLIASLRQPAEHAWSVWRAAKGDKRERGAFLAELESAQLWPGTVSPLREHGLFARRLKPFFDVAEELNSIEAKWDRPPRVRIKVLLFEELIARPQVVLADLLEWLGVDPTVQEMRRHNAAGAWRLGPTWLKELGRRVLPERWQRRIAGTVNAMPAKATPILPDHICRDLTARYYAEDIADLEVMIGRDLSLWRRHEVDEAAGLYEDHDASLRCGGY